MQGRSLTTAAVVPSHVGVIFLGADPAHPEAQTLMHISSETGTAQPLLPPDISVSRASRVISKEEELLRECVLSN